MAQLTSLLMYSLFAPSWTARKLDKKVTKQAKEANGVATSTDAGNFNKLILPDCDELKAITAHLGKVRGEFYLRTAPWGETRGVRVGKAEDHMELMQWFGDEQAKLGPLVRAFGAVYASKVAAMEYQLHDMFDANDYPMWDDVEGKFELRLSTSPLPNVNDVRVLSEIPQHIRDEIEASLKAEMESVYTGSIKHALIELLEPIAHMAKQLKAYDEGETKKIYASLIENIRTMASAARKLNIARDADTDKLAEEALRMVEDVTQEGLKSSDGARIVMRQKAEALAARIGQFLPS